MLDTAPRVRCLDVFSRSGAVSGVTPGLACLQVIARGCVLWGLKKHKEPRRESVYVRAAVNWMKSVQDRRRRHRQMGLRKR